MYFQFPPCVQGVHQNYSALHQKCPNMEFFQVRIFLYSEWIRRDTKYFSKYTNLFIFTKEIFYWKVSFLCSVYHNRQYAKHVKWKTKKKDMKDVKKRGKSISRNVVSIKHTCFWCDELIILWTLNRQAELFLPISKRIMLKP